MSRCNDSSKREEHSSNVLQRMIVTADLGPFYVAGLYRVIFKLQDEQLDWISNEIIEEAKSHN